MADFNYIISSLKTTDEQGKGTMSNPFILSQGENFSEVKSIDLEDCYVELPSFNAHQKLTKVENGFITNTNGSNMFNLCSHLTTFKSNLSNLTNGGYMFNGCSALTTFESDLSNLEDGDEMFAGNSNGNFVGITAFTTPLPKLINGGYMFQYAKDLHDFNVELPSLTGAPSMFYHSGIKTFTKVCNNLVNVSNMFDGCNELESINITLPQCGSANYTLSNCPKLKTVFINIPNVYDATKLQGIFQDSNNIESVTLTVDSYGINSFTHATLSLISSATLIVNGNTVEN